MRGTCALELFTKITRARREAGLDWCSLQSSLAAHYIAECKAILLRHRHFPPSSNPPFWHTSRHQ